MNYKMSELKLTRDKLELIKDALIISSNRYLERSGWYENRISESFKETSIKCKELALRFDKESFEENESYTHDELDMIRRALSDYSIANKNKIESYEEKKLLTNELRLLLDEKLYKEDKKMGYRTFR